MTATSSEFYVTGGSLRRDASCYVTRQADEELFMALSRAEFCYILTSRQMGKSSLMIRTSVRLREAGSRVVVLDLTAIGQNLTPQQWYDGLLLDIAQQLDLEDEMDAFWEQSERFGPLQRFMEALREVALSEQHAAPLIIFIDEIDTVRSLPFSTDEFFAAIRECYNRRANDPRFERLTFCLLGVASPTDLIRDTRMTPFNIGKRIELTDFSLEEAAPLAPMLPAQISPGRRSAEGDVSLSPLKVEPHQRAIGENRDAADVTPSSETHEPGSPPSLLRKGAGGVGPLARILYWTGGHPYLTQRLCQAVAAFAIENRKSEIDNQDVDRLCEQLFLSSQARERDDNLIFVRERLLKSEEDRATLLDFYGRVRSGQRIKNDETHPLIALLRLSGIVRAHDGYLHVRNRIYAQVFDKAWIRENMPDAEIRRQKQAFRRGVSRTLAIAFLLLAMLVGGVLLSRHQTHLNIRHDLPDGTILTLKDITYGKQHHYEGGPFRWQGLLEGPSHPLLTDTDCLEAWITYRTKNHTEEDFAPPIHMAAFDEHGCCFEAQWTYDADNFRYRLPAYLFRAFPRRGKTLDIRVWDMNGATTISDFVVTNPAPTLYPLWTPDRLPATKQDGDLSVTLTGVHGDGWITGNLQGAIARGPNNFTLVPEFQFHRNGKPTEDWKMEDGALRISDATGNESDIGPCNLCPYEPAWKLRAYFIRKDTAAFSPAETATIPGVVIPGAGQIQATSYATNLNGVRVEVKNVAGPGIFAYTNDGAGKAVGKWDPVKNGAAGFQTATSMNNNITVETLSDSSPHLRIIVTHMVGNQRLVVWATDAQGRRFNVDAASGAFGGSDNPTMGYRSLAIPPDVKTVDLHFVADSVRTAEFLIKPPLPPTKKDK